MSEIKIIDTGKVQLLIIKSPVGATRFQYVDGIVICMNDVGRPMQRNDIEGDYEFIGIHPELTEEKCREIMPDGKKKYIPGGYGIYYLNYKTGKLTMDTPKESWQSFLEANQIYSVNPFGTEKELRNVPAAGSPEWTNKVRDWEEAESNTGIRLILKLKKS